MSAQTPGHEPAFPVPNDANVNGQEGLSQRDYFAAAALTGYLASGTYSNSGAGFDEYIAAIAFNTADAMIAARSGGLS